jgi:ribosomal protein L12E/L44/L45/RPP1/RPP2
MAGNSVIGALRVDLGLNSAQFTAGLKNAETGLAAFGRTAAAGLQLVAVAATAAGVALGYAVKHAIDHADALNKSAQKAGVTVEALSRLEYAAKLSDVSLEGLTGGLQKLSKSMADAASGKGPATASRPSALRSRIRTARCGRAFRCSATWPIGSRAWKTARLRPHWPFRFSASPAPR